jgi:tryptophan halogenase
MIKNLTIVGGGTAGLISALILKKRFPNLNITIIKSDKIGIVGVGEGSTEHWLEFMNYCGISFKELIKECDATIKMGVMFENWTPKKYYHSVIGLHNIKLKFAQYLSGYGYSISKNIEQLQTADQHYINNTVFKDDLEKNISSSAQFHFNTFKLNEFLIKKCIENNIVIISDEIKNVYLNTKGEIQKIKGEKKYYISDFYIDCTGFKRLLITKMGAKWNSYKKYLKMNEAIAFQTKDTENYNTYTLAKAMNYGWMWRIPVYGRWGNGYIFNNEYINSEQAKTEVEKLLKIKIEIGKNIKFDPGSLENVWIKNCLAIGLSANFVEPLEATSIGTSINQIFLFMHYLSNYNERDIQQYNFKVNSIMNNIRDFIFLHYMVKKNNSQFWKDIKNLDIPESLKINLDKWKHRLPIREDFMDTNYFLFYESNFTSVLYGMNMFNINSIKKEYENYSIDMKNFIKQSIKENSDFYTTKECISHKQYLNYIRGDYNEQNKIQNY